jgi:hypothetical protein
LGQRQLLQHRALMIGIAIREEHESQFRSERSRVSDPMLNPRKSPCGLESTSGR